MNNLGWTVPMTVLTIAGLVLGFRGRPIGWVLGLVDEVVWVGYATATRQYPTYVSCACYFAMYSWCLYRWSREHHAAQAVARLADLATSRAQDAGCRHAAERRTLPAARRSGRSVLLAPSG